MSKVIIKTHFVEIKSQIVSEVWFLLIPVVVRILVVRIAVVQIQHRNLFWRQVRVQRVQLLK